jgi:pyruvate-ferredoxin/flavodoxin oxidoreductase
VCSVKGFHGCFFIGCKYSNTNSNCKLEIAKYYFFSTKRRTREMVCTLKHLSLCPEMEALYLFNPENDMALACGDPYYMAPASARRMVEAAKDKCKNCATIAEFKNYLVKKSQWIIGGDGASYDIGYGGLDHVIASGEDVNILVLDTEVYSNTGGQSSKATPLGAIAKFAASGKRVRKKDLGMIATTYGYVYVAQIAMGADQAQTLKAIREAEAYPGPSLVIAYAPCINHGLKAGMGKSQAEEAKAVECGYWHLWRFNPALEEEGKNPFMLDSKEPKWEGFQDFLKNEVRFASVMKQYPAEAADLFAACEEMAKKRYASYKRMEAMNWGE